MKRALLACCLLLAAAAALAADKPSRAAFEGCAWHKLSSETLGLDAWVQRCDHGGNKTDFVVQDHVLAMSFSGGEKPEPVVRLFDLLPGETAEAGLRRIFRSKTDKKVANRCVLAAYQPPSKRPGVKRYEFVPDKAYKNELDKVAQDGIPDPPCGDLGTQPDTVQYFEVHAGASKVMLIDAGQDEPLFDEETLRLLPAKK